MIIGAGNKLLYNGKEQISDAHLSRNVLRIVHTLRYVCTIYFWDLRSRCVFFAFDLALATLLHSSVEKWMKLQG